MFSSILTGVLDMKIISLCVGISLLCGAIISLTYMHCTKISKSFAISIVLLPILVQVVIMMVNGNLGAGVAVAGAFSLIRFRSLPGKASDIITIFFAMSIGLATGMGYVYYALIVTIFVCAIYLLMFKTSYGDTSKINRILKITIPEDLDYTEVFDDLLKEYTNNYELQEVKTTNLGSMYQLVYDVTMKDIKKEKEMIDQIRCRNGNLTVISARQASTSADL